MKTLPLKVGLLFQEFMITCYLCTYEALIVLESWVKLHKNRFSHVARILTTSLECNDCRFIFTVLNFIFFKKQQDVPVGNKGV